MTVQPLARRRLLPLLVPVLIGCSVAPAAAAARTVRYRGYRLTVPAGWPVHRISPRSTVCVRFDRHAVYLGAPGSDQRCPPQEAGRSEAILVQPLAGSTLAPALGAGADAPGSGSLVRLVSRRHGVVVTATWHRHPAVIARALGLRSVATLRARAKAARTRPRPTAAARRRITQPALSPAAAVRSHALVEAALTAVPGAVYDGLGFDACSAPSSSVMSAWGKSPFHAVGIYIGGANMACSQPNLTAAWVSGESAVGWHLIPLYVGLQAPTNSCGCAGITSSKAATQGATAAGNAVAEAQALGIGTGNPIYFDMEGYSHTTANTKAVLSFLGGWTQALHGDGYRSGVYSSADSGIADLVSRLGTSYAEPDDVWFADWNGAQALTDPVLPATAWPDGQRLHQYEGGHDAAYGGDKLDIDSDDLDGATAAAGSSGSVAAAAPVPIGAPSVTGTPVAGQTLSEHHGSWSGDPQSYSYQWELCDPGGAGCTPIAGATAARYSIDAADAGGTLRVLEDATNPVGTGGPAGSAATPVVAAAPVGYWLYTAYGNVYNSRYEPFYGSPAASHRGVRTIAGMAASADGGGYWLVTRAGRVYRYGDAASLPALHPARPVEGIVAAASGGYWLYTARGNVYGSRGAGWHGSPARRHLRTVSGMAATADGGGYWLVTRSGRAYAYGDAARLPSRRPAHPVIGIVSDPSGGCWLYTAYGNVYGGAGAAWHGSPAHSHLKLRNVVGMLATPDGGGYWLATSGGGVHPYGDADSYPAPAIVHPVTGAAGG